MKTSTEKYNAVLEGTLSKAEFVRQMRLAHPNLISQFNGYNDTVQILKNRGMIFEAKQEEKGYQKLNVSLEAIDRGIRFELLAAGLEPFGDVSEEEFAKAKGKAEKNLEKDPLFYLNKLADVKSVANREDINKETKRGALEVDQENGMKKANLKEANVAGHDIKLKDEKENIIAVAREIRAKYGDMPKFNSLLKDYLQTHMEDVKSGKVDNPVADFDNFLDANYDTLDEKAQTINEVADAIELLMGVLGSAGLIGASIGIGEFQEKAREGKYGPKVQKLVLAIEKKAGEVNRATGNTHESINEAADAIELLMGVLGAAGLIGTSIGIGEFQEKAREGKYGPKVQKLVLAIEKKAGQINRATGNTHEAVNENHGPDMAQIFSIIKDRASDSGFSEQEEAMEVMEAIGQEYEIDFEFGAGPSRMAEEYSVFKNYDDIIGGIHVRFGALEDYVQEKEPEAMDDLQKAVRAFEIFDEKMTYGAHEELEEDHSGNPNDKYVVRPCKHPVEKWAVWEGEVRVKGFAEKKDAQAFADKKNKEQGLNETTKEQIKEAIKKVIKNMLNEGMGRVGQIDSTYYDITNLLNDLEENPGIFTNLKIDFSGWHDEAESGDGKIHRIVTVYPDGYNHKDAAFSIYDYKESFDPGDEDNIHEELRWSLGGYSGTLARYLAQELGFDII